MASRALPVPCAGLTAARTRAAVGRALIAVGATVAAGGCVQAFDGSNVQIDFSTGVQTATRVGATPQPDQPPPDTHYELYAADLVYQLDPEGNVVRDDRGHPVVAQSYMFQVAKFAITPVINRASPCLIELEGTRYPGLHVTQIRTEVEEDTGVTDPFAPGVPANDVTDVLNARRRVANLERLEVALKVVASHQAFHYPATAPVGQCPPTSADALPDPGCRDAVSNAQRLRRCENLWAAHPDFYEGSDKVFTLPLNGHYLGMVAGTNPLNDASVGGSSLFVDANLVDHDQYYINWQYDDLDGNGSPDFPAALPAAQRSPVGYLYMAGTPVDITRGVITVPLRHPSNTAIGADLAILPNLGHDDVHF